MPFDFDFDFDFDADEEVQIEMGMNLIQYRNKLRSLLKDSGALWSDAELNDSVRTAVNELSRFIPLERVYETTLSFTVTGESFTTPAAASDTAIVNAQTLNGKVDGDTLTIADQTPSVPRRLTCTLTDANNTVTSLTITVKGYDQDGNYIEESWYLKDLPSGTAVQGNLYFKMVETVEVTEIAGTAAAGDTISIGSGNAYDSMVFLANKPIRPESETVTSSPAGTTYTRDTDYTIDYVNGGIKYISTGAMAAGTAYLIGYTKSRLGINISNMLPVLTRIHQVEYPADKVPQQFVSFNIFGDFMYIAGLGSKSSQTEMDTAIEHMLIYYERMHMPPGEGSPGSYPSLLDEVVVIGACAYALLIEALQYEQAAATAITAMNTALTNVIKYLNNNTSTDMAGILQDITDDVANLRTKVNTAVDAVATNLGLVFTNSLDKATTGAEAYLDTGDGDIDAVNIGANVAENYALYSRTRAEIAGQRIQATGVYIQEAATRLSNLAAYIQQAGGYRDLALGFAEECRQRGETVNGNLVLSDRFRAEGLARLNEFHSILMNRAQYRKRTVSNTLRQPA